MHLEIAEALWEEALKTKTKNLDKKHAKIVESAKENTFEYILRDYKNSKLQNDMGAPFQFNFYSLLESV